MRTIITYGAKIGSCFVIAALLSVIGLISEHASAVEWANQPIYAAQEPVETTIPISVESCPGYAGYIPLASYDSPHRACLFGDDDSVRVARYLNTISQHEYAIAFKGDREYTPISNVCTNMRMCVYSQSHDTFLIQEAFSSHFYGHTLLKDFTKHLSLTTANGRREYVVDYQSIDTIPVGHIWGRFATNTVGISRNGDWALVELKSFGFVRLNMNGYDMRRVIAPGARYGVASDPGYEVTVSNDGRLGAVMGYGVGFEVYQFNDGCGDRLGHTMQERFSADIIPCPRAVVDANTLFPGFWFGQMPRFSGDGSQLSAYVQRYNHQSRVVVSPIQQSIGVPLRYVGLGDSFTSGEGEERDTFYLPGTDVASNRCHVSYRSYPNLVAQLWGMEPENRACSGSRLPDVIEAARAHLPRDTPSIVSIGVGGNDVDFIGKLKTCLGVGTCDWAKEGNRRATYEEIHALFYKLSDAIEQIKSDFPLSKVMLVGYPLAINEVHDATCHPVIGTMLSAEERLFMHESIKYLNTVIHGAANYARVKYINAETAFQGERLCEGSSKAMNGLRFGNDIAPIPLLSSLKFIGAESFHPRPYGHEKIATLLTAQVTPQTVDSRCTECSHDWPEIHSSEYWGVRQGDNHYYQESVEMISQPIVTVGSTIDIGINHGMFKANSSVRVELHSDIRELGGFTATTEGGAMIQVDLPQGVEGYHTLFVIGQSPSGNEVRYYETLFIGSQVYGVLPGADTLPVTGGEDGTDTSIVPTIRTLSPIPSTSIGILTAESHEPLVTPGPVGGSGVLGMSMAPPRVHHVSNEAQLARPLVKRESNSIERAHWLPIGVGAAIIVLVVSGVAYLLFKRFHKRGGNERV